MPLSPPPSQARRSALRLLTLATVALAVTGCVPRGRPVVERPRPEPQAQVRPEPSRLPPGETLNRVAVLVPLTGSTAPLGQSLLNAANLALLDTGGQRIRITAYDTARGAEVAANEALAGGSGLILGPLLADDVRIVAPIARRANVPVIAFSNDVTVAGDNVYIMGLNPAQSIDRVVGHARTGGAQRFGALVPTGVYGQRASLALASSVQRAGGQIVGMETYDRAATSLRSAAGRLLARGPLDAVLVADGARGAVQAAALLRRSGQSARLLGTELWANETGGGNAQLRGAWYAAPSDTLFDQFRTRYRTRYTRDPSRLASLGYDAVLLAIRIGADWPLGRSFPARALRDQGGFLGVDGAFRFGREGVAQRSLEVREVTASGVTVVSPAPRGFD